MGKRFYCDFCDKAFPDNATNRRIHLNGLQHQQARRLHYDQFLNPTERLLMEKSKKPCHTFMNTGSCTFGPSCKYSHQTQESMRLLEEAAERQARERESVAQLASEENIKIQLRKFEVVALERSKRYIIHHLPNNLTKIELPPSLNAD